MAGCRPATYRLDAVDDGRAQLGVTAYTEVRRGVEGSGDDGEESVVPGGTSDAAVAALARAVEAMQRVQAEREKASAERERVHADLIARLVERLAPAPAQAAPRNLSEVLDEHVDVSKRLDELAPPADEQPAGKDAVLIALQPSIEKMVGIIGAAAMDFMDSRKKKAAASKKKAAKEVEEPDATAAVEEGAGEDEVEEPREDSRLEIMGRIGEVEQKLTAEEQTAVQIAISSMAPEALGDLTGRLMEMTVDDAVAEVRRMLSGKSRSNGASKKSNGVSAETRTEGGGDDSQRN